ncbi:hypothetical protein NX059_001966 [Plenodomus lindquistii]|nr:hypothetical protein NX059_001966 [Plenodomus lindquistii]
MLLDDPWCWSATDLVAELCHETALLEETGYPREQFPNRALLERCLLVQNIDGSAFLTRFDIETLRSELKLEDRGHRIVLVSLIESLRQRSPLYAQSRATMGVASLNLNHTHDAGHFELGVDNFRNPPDSIDAFGRKGQRITPMNTEPPRETHVSSSNTGVGDYSHLLKWQSSHDVDEVVDFAASDELEDDSPEDEISDGPEEEDDEEAVVETGKEAQARCKLTQDEIADIINQSIAQYTAHWKPNKGVPREQWVTYDPEAMWEEAEANHQRQQFVETYEAEMKYYTHRLDILCNGIVNFPGNNVEAILHQCKNLEVTVNNLELAGWLLSIYELPPESNGDEDVHDAEDANLSPIWDLKNHSDSVRGARQVAGQVVNLGSPPASSTSETGGVSLPRHTTFDVAIDFTSSSPIVEYSPSHRVTSPDQLVATIEANPPSELESLIPLHGAPPNAHSKHGENPENASILTVRGWKWEDLVETLDRKRVVTKAIHEMHENNREDMRNRLELLARSKIEREVKAYIDMLVRKESRIQGVLARDLRKIETMSGLFISWWCCDNYFVKEPSKRHLKELLHCIETRSSDIEVFLDYLSTVMNTTFSKEALRNPEQPSQAEIIVISDDEDVPKPPGIARRRTRSGKESGLQHYPAIVLD